jgi:hypothetical protein
MNSNERKKLIEKCCEILTRDGIIFVCPDIMPLTLRSSFKYLVFSYILKYWVKMPFFIEGDSLRPSLESKSTHNSTVKIGLVYYHYFPSENHFTSEWKQLNFKVEKINSEFYMIKK